MTYVSPTMREYLAYCRRRKIRFTWIGFGRWKENVSHQPAGVARAGTHIVANA